MQCIQGDPGGPGEHITTAGGRKSPAPSGSKGSSFSLGCLSQVATGAFLFPGVDLYRTVDTATWTDPKVKSLNSDGKLLFIYLITNPHSHVSGIYYLTLYDVSHETGLAQRQLKRILDTLSDLKLCHFDTGNEVFWVRNMFFYQGRGERNQRAAANQLQSLHKSYLIKDFLEIYPEVSKFISARLSSKLDRVSEAGIPDQERDQDQSIKKPPGKSVGKDIEIFNHWNKMENLVTHKELNPDTKTAIRNRRNKGYVPSQIRMVITNYDKLCGNGHAPGYGKWSLLELMRSVKYFDPLLSEDWEGFIGKEEQPKLAEDRGLYEHGWSEKS